MTSPIAFQPSEKGFCFDVNDLALNHGDPVASWADCGKSNNIAQATAANRPLFQNVGGSKYVLFDGVNDTLFNASVDMSSSSFVTFVAVFRHADSAVKVTAEHGVPSATGIGGFGLYPNNSQPYYGAGLGINASNYVFSNFQTNISGVDSYIVTEFNPSAANNNDRIKIRLNGVDVSDPIVAQAGAPTNASFGTKALYVGSRGGSQYFSSMRLYGLFCINRQLTPSELTQVETWAANLIGQVPPTVYTLDNLVWDGDVVNSSQGAWTKTSSFAETSFYTEATSIDVDIETDMLPTYADFAKLQVMVNGEYHATIAATVNGADTKTVSLPAGFKLVTLVNGPQTSPSSTTLGTWVKEIRALSPLKACKKENIVVYGDSISNAGTVTNTDREGWTVKLRDYCKRVTVDGFGWRTLNEDNVTNLVNAWKLQNPSVIWLAIGTNDYGLSQQSAANFQTKYDSLLTEINTEMPNTRVFAQTPLLRSSEGANSFGNTLGQYRTAIVNAAVGKSLVTVVDGTLIVPLADMPDGLHPNTTGHEKYSVYVKQVI